MFELEENIYFGLFLSFILILALYSYFIIWRKKKAANYAEAHLWDKTIG